MQLLHWSAISPSLTVAFIFPLKQITLLLSTAYWRPEVLPENALTFA